MTNPIRQPYGTEHYTADGVAIKQMIVEDAGSLVPQHSHAYDHTTLIASGAFRIWADTRLLGDFVAPSHVFIKAQTFHKLLSLVPHSVAYCIHNVARTGGIELAELCVNGCHNAPEAK